jgi:hypothetical protein
MKVGVAVRSGALCGQKRKDQPLTQHRKYTINITSRRVRVIIFVVEKQ